MRRLTTGQASEIIDGELVDTVDELRQARQRIQELETENLRLRQKNEVDELKYRSVSHAVNALRSILKPEYDVMRVLMGEIDASGLVEEPAEQHSRNGSSNSTSHPAVESMKRWESTAAELGGTEGEIIRMLMKTGPKTNKQLRPLIRCAYSTTAILTLKLKNMGFLEKQGNAYALKKS